jgi:methionyl-tRNA formyltransferase
MQELSIGYFADGPWSHETLGRLLSDKSIEIKFICARHDKPDETLKSAAKVNGIDFFTHPKVNSIEFFNKVAGYGCDLFVSMSFNQIFKNNLINLPPLKIINCHAGKLPFYRGRNVLNWVLINDENEFGITVHFIDEGIDTGDIILQKTFKIDDTDDYQTLLSTAYKECSSILYDSIKLVQTGNVPTFKQSNIDAVGSYCVTRVKGDENLDWNQTSRDIFNFVRSICRPGPQASTTLNGESFKVNRVELVVNANNYKGIPGSVVGIEPTSFIVKTADNLIRVTEWDGCKLPKIGDRFL